jgi:drug/metabolite transporter (DMT)-like permease
MALVRSSGTFLCLASGAAFGTMAIFGKLAYDGGASVGTLLVARFVLAAAMFWVLVLAGGDARRLRALGARDIGMGLALGACGYAIQAACYFAALERIDASLLALLVYTFPGMVAVAAVALGRERIDARRGAALGLASGGTMLVVAGAGAGALDSLGIALGLGAAVVYSTYILVSEGISRRVPPLLLSALVCTGAAVSLASGSALMGELRPAEVTAAGWGSLACLALVATVAAISLFFAGLRRAGPTRASILATVEPLVTVVLAFIAFGDTLGWVQVLGGVLVLGGVVVLQAGRLPKRETQPVDPDHPAVAHLEPPASIGLLEEGAGGRPPRVGDQGLRREPGQQRQEQGDAGALVEHISRDHEIKRPALDERLRVLPVDRGRVDLHAVGSGVPRGERKRFGG